MCKRLLATAVFALASCGSGAAPSGPPAEDKNAPDIALLSVSPVGAAKGTLLDITWTVSRKVTRVEALVGTSPAACLAPSDTQISCAYTVQGNEPEGKVEVTARAVDEAGRESVAKTTVTLDFTPPLLTFSVKPPSLSNQKTPRVEFAANEKATLTCALDGEAAAACTSPRTLSGLADGKHRFAVVATDAVGNQGFGTIEFTVDYKGPDTSIDQPPRALSNANTLPVGFVAGESPASFECRVDNDPFVAGCTSPWILTGLAEGPHTFEVRAVDPAGNVDPSPAKASFVIDRTRPRTTVVAPPDLGKPDVAVAFIADEAADFECSLDGSAFVRCSSPHQLHLASDGPHTDQIRAVDRAGNVENPGPQVVFVVDTTAPTANILTGPAQLWNSPSATFTFNSSEAPSIFECRVDSGPFGACTSPFSTTVTVDGPHSFEVRATDKYGNQQVVATTQGWQVDAFGPTVTLAGSPPPLTNATSATFTFTANKPCNFSCVLDGGQSQPCFSPEPVSALASGPHTFTVIGTDSGGRPSAPVTATWTVDTQLPVATFVRSPAPLSNAATAHFEFSSNEPNSTFECVLDAAPAASCSSPSDVAVTHGSHTFSVTAIDPAGNHSRAAVVTFDIDLLPPAVPQLDQPDPSLVANSTPTLTWRAAVDAETYTAEIASVPDFAQVTQTRVNTVELFMVPAPLRSSRYYFRVKAKDKAGNESAYSRTGIIEIRSWGFLNPSPQGATILGQDCRSATACWFVGEAGLALRTSDGGATLSRSSTGVLGNLNAVHVFDASNAVAVGDGGAIVRTSDGGITWLSVSSGLNSALHGLRFKGAIGFAVGDAGVALKSTDSGLSWTRQRTNATASFRDVAILDAAATTLVAVGGTGTVIRSEDSGATWTTASNPASAQLNAVTFVDALAGYAVGAAGTMRKTVDGGKIWGTVATGITQELHGLSFSDALTGYTLGDSTSSLSAMRKTVDGGVSWTNVTLTANAPLHALSFIGGTSTAFASGDGGNVLVSSNGAASFSLAAGVSGGPNAGSNQELRAVQFVSPTAGFVFGGTGYARRTLDGGATFDPMTGLSATAVLYAASFLDDRIGYVGGDNVLAKTSDGLTFAPLAGFSGAAIRGIHFKTVDVGAAVGTNGKIFRWNPTTGAFDPEQAVDSVGTPVTSSWRAVKLVSARAGFVVGDAGRIAGYDAPSSSWQLESTGVSVTLNGVWAFDATSAIAVGDLGKILRRTASGWSTVISGTDVTLKDVTFADANNGWIVGNGVILSTVDGGLNWTSQICPTGITLQSVSAPSANVVYAAGASRNLLKTTSGGR